MENGLRAAVIFGQAAPDILSGAWKLVDLQRLILSITRRCIYTADQTLAWQDYPSLLEYYSALVCFRSAELQKVSKYLAADAYFSRLPFIEAVCSTGLQVVSRLRNDAALLYPYVGPHPKRKGAKTKYLGKVDFQKLDESYLVVVLKKKIFGFMKLPYFQNP